MLKRTLGSVLVLAFAASLTVVSADAKTPHHRKQFEKYRSKSEMPFYESKYPSQKQYRTQYKVSRTQDLLSRGRLNLVERDYEGAIDNFRDVLRRDPRQVTAEEGLAIAYYHQGDYTRALDHINSAFDIDPVYTKLYVTRGKILDALDREPEALDNYLTFVVLDPTDTQALQVQHRANQLLKRWEHRLSTRQRNYIEGLRYLSWGQPQNAIPAIKAFMEDQPHSVNAHFLLGLAYQELDRPSDAVRYFSNITKEQPKSPTAYYYLGESYLDMGKNINAREAWRRFKEQAPDSQAIENVDRRRLYID